MGFSNFAVGMGNVAVGMEDMAGKMQDRQLRAQYAEQMAGQVRRQQQEEADNNRLSQMNQEMLRRMQSLNQRYTGNLDPQQHGEMQAPSTPAAKPEVAPRTAGQAPTQKAPDYDADIKTYEGQLADVKSKLDGLRAKDDQYKRGQRELAAGTAKPIAAAADVLTLPYNVGGMVVEKAANAAGHVVNSAAGRKVVRDDYDTFSKRGVTPYYDEHVRKAGRENPAISPEEQDLRQQQAGLEHGLKRFQELKRRSGKQAGNNPTGAPVTPDADYAQRHGSIMSMFPNASPVVTPQLVAAIKGVENKSGDPNAVSPKGAFGVMQTMPGTFNDMSKMYFDGKLDPKNPNHQEMAGVAYLNHLATVELPRLGLPVTPENIASAYQQGPGGLAKNGVSAGVNDGITNNAQYTQKVMAGMGGAQPQQQAAAPRAAAPQQATPQIQGQYTSVAGANYDPQAEQRQYMQQYLTNVIQTVRNPQVQQQAMMQLMDLQIKDANARVDGLSRAAQFGDTNALQQLASMYAGPGNRVGIAPLNNGGVGLVANGKVIEAFESPAHMASALQRQLNTELYAAAQARAAKTADVYGTKQAEAAGQHPYKMAEEALKGNIEFEKARITGNIELQKAMIVEQLKLMGYGRPQTFGEGGAVVFRNDGSGAQVMLPPVTKNGITSMPQMQTVTPGLQVPRG